MSASSVISTDADATSAALKIGYPVVLKVVGEAHKTEHDGIVLDIRDEPALLSVAERLFVSSDQLLVESFCSDAVAELLIGIVRESSGLLTLTIGAGGVLTELLRDTKCLLLPASDDDIACAINELKIAALLHGYRNKPAANLTAVVRQISLLCNWAVQHANRLQEVEVNPLLCLHDRAIVADALINMGQTP